ncbi:sorbosone dehydrogenase family protein [bacterium]|nr:sorbosone dehydrogenase family protein [bacterium]
MITFAKRSGLLTSAGALIISAALAILLGCTDPGQADPNGMSLPEDFILEEYATVPNARSMTLGAEGTLFVGTRESRVYAVVDDDQDMVADTVYVIADGLTQPNGVAFRDGALYIAEISRVLRFDEIESNLDSPPDPVVIRDDFPTDRHHGWKFIAFGPDDKLYVPVGAPCNVCDSEDERYASLMRMNPDGNELEIYARGIRNTVGFTWHPETEELWFTDNGRDWLGDNLPPDELNHAPEQGLHYGFPFVHGNGITDPEFGDSSPDGFSYQPPAQELGPHVAALGLRFYTGEMFPEEYKGQLFIAEHGSWNRSSKIGYRVMRVRLEEGVAMEYEPFVTGWLKGDGRVTGRPVDVQQLPDGSMLISDDFGGKIWRLRYGR